MFCELLPLFLEKQRKGEKIIDLKKKMNDILSTDGYYEIDFLEFRFQIITPKYSGTKYYSFSVSKIEEQKEGIWRLSKKTKFGLSQIAYDFLPSLKKVQESIDLCLINLLETGEENLYNCPYFTTSPSTVKQFLED